MKTSVVVLSGNYHFGDNPGVFQDAAYIGLSLELPLFVDLSNTEKLGDACIMFETHDIETWDEQGWQGHQILLNGFEIGRLKDPSDRFGRTEKFSFSVSREKLKELLGGENGAVTLKIKAERQKTPSTMIDDFVLTRIEVGGFAAWLGCK